MDKKILKQIAGAYGTPAYVFDLDLLQARVRMIRNCLGKRIRLCYAMKANPFLIGALNKVIDGYEVCSPGEYRICERAGISPEKIVVSGVHKEKEELIHALEYDHGKGIYTIESRRHLELLETCAAEKAVRIRALIRVTSGNQFGVDPEEVCRMIADRDAYSHVEIVGLQMYSGTQKKKLSKIEKELHQLDELIASLYERYGYEAEELEYGPGFYVPYFEGDGETDDWALLKEFDYMIDRLRFQGTVTLEMGRYIAAYCGYYLTSVVDQKKNQGQKYCIVDGGIHHLTYYGQAMAMKRPRISLIRGAEEAEKRQEIRRKEMLAAEEECWNICGSLCTVNDVIVKQLPLCDVQRGDVLVFERTGAYAVTEGIYLFLSRDLPKVLLYTKADGVRTVREKRSTDEINSIGAEWQ